MITTTQLQAQALADPDNVGAHEPLDVVVARIELAFSDITDCMIEASRLPVGRLHAEELAAKQRAHDLLRAALIQRALWGIDLALPADWPLVAGAKSQRTSEGDEP